jgi:hypothetical protein
VEFEQDGATFVSSDGAETIWWDVATGARKDKVAGQFAFTGWDRALHRDQGRRPDIRYDTRGAVVNADGGGKVLTAFFRAPCPITMVSCAGDKIAVVCENFSVLTLHAPWLTGRGAA